MVDILYVWLANDRYFASKATCFCLIYSNNRLSKRLKKVLLSQLVLRIFGWILLVYVSSLLCQSLLFSEFCLVTIKMNTTINQTSSARPVSVGIKVWKLKVKRTRQRLQDLSAFEWKLKVESWKLKVEKLKVERTRQRLQDLSAFEWKLKVKSWKLKEPDSICKICQRWD